MKYFLLLISIIVFQLTAQDNTHWYIFAGGGSGEVEVVGHDRSQMVSDLFSKSGIGVSNTSGGQDDGTDVFHIGVGYILNENFSIEGAYHDFGDTSGSFSAQLDSDASIINGKLDSEYQALSLSLVGQYPIIERLAFTGQLGIHYWEHEVNISGSNPTASINEDDTDDGIDFIYGFGLKFNINDNFQIMAGWNRFYGIEDEDGIDTKYLSLIYKF